METLPKETLVLIMIDDVIKINNQWYGIIYPKVIYFDNINDIGGELMPFKSQAQRKWAYTKEGTKALGGKSAVAEWERATGNKKLPKTVKKK